MSKPLKIAVAEPSLIVRSGVLAVLKRINSLHVEVFEIGETEQIKNQLAWQKPDILIINSAVMGMYSPQQVRKDAGNPEMKCVALQTSLTDPAQARIYDETISLYDSADHVRDKLVRLASDPEPEKRYESLSAREKEVIVCVIKGMTNKQIAEVLHLSTHTVITHRRNISAKLDIRSTAGLTIYAIVNKLVDLEEVKDLVAESDE